MKSLGLNISFRFSVPVYSTNRLPLINSKSAPDSVVRAIVNSASLARLTVVSTLDVAIVNFVEKYVGTNKTDEIDTYLYEENRAKIMSHRNTFLQSLGRTDIKLTSDLRLEDLEIGDTVIINFDRLFKRFGDSDSRKKAVILVGKTVNGERTILEFSDLGNVFNRATDITPVPP